MIVGCYALDLYCDTPSEGPWHPRDIHAFQEFPHQFNGYETGAEARSQARRKGWSLRPNGTALCPKCNPRSPHYVKPEINQGGAES